MALKSVSLSSKDFHSSTSSSVSLTKCSQAKAHTSPIQPVVHEDEDGELAGFQLLEGLMLEDLKTKTAYLLLNMPSPLSIMILSLRINIEGDLRNLQWGLHIFFLFFFVPRFFFWFVCYHITKFVVAKLLITRSLQCYKIKLPP